MNPFEKCPVCGGAMTTRQVEKILSGGGNTASLQVAAEVCLQCGEHLYTKSMVLSFEEIRRKLQAQEFSHFKRIGQSFTLEDGWPEKAVKPVP